MDKTNNNKYDITERDVEELIKFTRISNWGRLIDVFNNPKDENGEIVAKYILAKYERLCKSKTLDEMIAYEKLQIYNCKADFYYETNKDPEQELGITSDDFKCMESILSKDELCKYYTQDTNDVISNKVSLDELDKIIQTLKDARKNSNDEQVKIACIKFEILNHKAKFDIITNSNN